MCLDAFILIIVGFKFSQSSHLKVNAMNQQPIPKGLHVYRNESSPAHTDPEGSRTRVAAEICCDLVLRQAHNIEACLGWFDPFRVDVMGEDIVFYKHKTLSESLLFEASCLLAICNFRNVSRCVYFNISGI
ncbi:hypothetical protein CYPRO_1278 [Cyclonatronum proteinivorum]|uniref:Uncharacterized protein n=1 Tax=Cyclonatronum proteinivorum TaxID=1457365 RepID=A0A345UJ83_9BACT|nr:hypothetical protein CYPRO_1278 [Cyclonatronum proteinivorum]